MSGACKWWDCGWCYAPDGKQSNDDNGQCNKPEQCKELERQEHELNKLRSKMKRILEIGKE